MTDGENVLLTVRELSKILTTELENGGIEDAKAEAGFILMHITGESHPILTMGDKPLSKYKAEEAFSICKRRTYGEPLQYILGDWDFSEKHSRLEREFLFHVPIRKHLWKKQFA